MKAEVGIVELLKIWFKFFAYSFLVLYGSFASAANYGQAGCGLGATRSSNQVSAASSNGLFGIRYLAITFGTSQCSAVPADAGFLLEAYMMENYYYVSRDVASGGGPSLTALAELLGCNKQAGPEFNALLQSRHQNIFVEPGAMAALDSLLATVAENDRLAENCSLISAKIKTGGVR